MTDKMKQEPIQTAQKTTIDYSDFWDRSWKEEDAESLSNWLEKWQNSTSPEIKLFKSYGVKTVCDAACGFGAHTVSLASNGFDVSAFDVSPKAVVQLPLPIRSDSLNSSAAVLTASFPTISLNSSESTEP